MGQQQEPPTRGRGHLSGSLNVGCPANNEEEQRTHSNYQGEGQRNKDNFREKITFSIIVLE